MMTFFTSEGMMHTKGPYRADDNGDGTHCITAGLGVDVAHTCAAANEADNARLLVAAPDLLFALKRLWGSSRSEPVGREGKDCWLVSPEALADALVAIKKAEGK